MLARVLPVSTAGASVMLCLASVSISRPDAARRFFVTSSACSLAFCKAFCNSGTPVSCTVTPVPICVPPALRACAARNELALQNQPAAHLIGRTGVADIEGFAGAQVYQAHRLIYGDRWWTPDAIAA